MPVFQFTYPSNETSTLSTTWLAIVKLSARTARSSVAPPVAFLNVADVAVTLPVFHSTSVFSVVVPRLNAAEPCVWRIT